MIERFDQIYNYKEKVKIKMKNEFAKKYYYHTITLRPFAYYLRTWFRIDVEGDYFIFYKRENRRIYEMFMELVKEFPGILAIYVSDSESAIKRLEDSIESLNPKSVYENLFEVGKYGLQWYYPYDLFRQRLIVHFPDLDAERIAITLRKPTKITYFDLIALGIGKYYRGEISWREYLEYYASASKTPQNLKTKYEDRRYIDKIAPTFSNIYEDEIRRILFRNKLEKEKVLNMLKVDDTLYYLGLGYSYISDEDEMIRITRGRAIKFLLDNGLL